MYSVRLGASIQALLYNLLNQFERSYHIDLDIGDPLGSVDQSIITGAKIINMFSLRRGNVKRIHTFEAKILQRFCTLHNAVVYFDDKRCQLEDLGCHDCIISFNDREENREN